MARARPAEGELGRMTRSVAERVIYEANLGAEDTKIARMYYIERLPQIEIAAEMQVDRKTIYSDFCVALEECGIQRTDTACYAKLARAWLMDEDAEEGKAKRYFEFIVK